MTLEREEGRRETRGKKDKEKRVTSSRDEIEKKNSATRERKHLPRKLHDPERGKGVWSGLRGGEKKRGGANTVRCYPPGKGKETKNQEREERDEKIKTIIWSPWVYQKKNINERGGSKGGNNKT